MSRFLLTLVSGVAADATATANTGHATGDHHHIDHHHHDHPEAAVVPFSCSNHATKAGCTSHADKCQWMPQRIATCVPAVNTFEGWIDTFVDGSSLCTAAGGSMVQGCSSRCALKENSLKLLGTEPNDAADLTSGNGKALVVTWCEWNDGTNPTGCKDTMARKRCRGTIERQADGKYHVIPGPKESCNGAKAGVAVELAAYNAFEMMRMEMSNECEEMHCRIDKDNKCVEPSKFCDEITDNEETLCKSTGFCSYDADNGGKCSADSTKVPNCGSQVDTNTCSEYCEVMDGCQLGKNTQCIVSGSGCGISNAEGVVTTSANSALCTYISGRAEGPCMSKENVPGWWTP